MACKFSQLASVGQDRAGVTRHGLASQGRIAAPRSDVSLQSAPAGLRFASVRVRALAEHRTSSAVEFLMRPGGVGSPARAREGCFFSGVCPSPARKGSNKLRFGPPSSVAFPAE